MADQSDRELLEAAAKEPPQVFPKCSDHDDECPEVANKVNCWLYAPERGMCPYLRAAASSEGGKG
jgi:hypothetical protein